MSAELAAGFGIIALVAALYVGGWLGAFIIDLLDAPTGFGNHYGMFRSVWARRAAIVLSIFVIYAAEWLILIGAMR